METFVDHTPPQINQLKAYGNSLGSMRGILKSHTFDMGDTGRSILQTYIRHLPDPKQQPHSRWTWSFVPLASCTCKCGE